MTPLALFCTLFAITVAALAGALWSGLRARRRWHLLLGPAALVSLAATIMATERLAATRSFPPEVLRIHLVFANLGAFLALPVIATGIYLACTRRGRRAHRVAIVVFLIGTLVATGTGVWMFSQSQPR